MSTKTTFKRVALVAVVALGLGGLSSVAAHAVASTVSSITVGPVRYSAGDAVNDADLSFVTSLAITATNTAQALCLLKRLLVQLRCM
jgi:hypothetical protein